MITTDLVTAVHLVCIICGRKMTSPLNNLNQRFRLPVAVFEELDNTIPNIKTLPDWVILMPTVNLIFKMRKRTSVLSYKSYLK